MFGRLSVAVIVLVICMVSLFTLNSSSFNPPRSEVISYLIPLSYCSLACSPNFNAVGAKQTVLRAYLVVHCF